MRSSGMVTLSVLVCSAVSDLAVDYAWLVIWEVDGDTVAVDTSADLAPKLARQNVRLRDVDST